MTQPLVEKLQANRYRVLVFLLALILAWVSTFLVWRLLKLEPAPIPGATNPRSLEP